MENPSESPQVYKDRQWVKVQLTDIGRALESLVESYGLPCKAQHSSIGESAPQQGRECNCSQNNLLERNAFNKVTDFLHPLLWSTVESVNDLNEEYYESLIKYMKNNYGSLMEVFNTFCICAGQPHESRCMGVEMSAKEALYAVEKVIGGKIPIRVHLANNGEGTYSFLEVRSPDRRMYG